MSVETPSDSGSPKDSATKDSPKENSTESKEDLDEQDDEGDEEEEEAKALFHIPSEIMTYLFLGSYRHSVNRSYLLEKKIVHILCVAEDAKPVNPKQYRFLHVPISDFGDTVLVDVLPECFEFIDEAKKKGRAVLVHCSQGINRSPTVVIAYLMAKEGWSLRKAYDHVKSKRRMISPHELYFEQLQQYEVKLTGKSTVSREEAPKSLQAYIRELRAKMLGKDGDDEPETAAEAEPETTVTSNSTVSTSDASSAQKNSTAAQPTSSTGATSVTTSATTISHSDNKKAS
jgi:protein-tyrosine phosphatase